MAKTKAQKEDEVYVRMEKCWREKAEGRREGSKSRYQWKRTRKNRDKESKGVKKEKEQERAKEREMDGYEDWY